VFLRQLTLKGFKSFAETTVLTLEPGVTVVVGPNGSGKSNVVDAIAWVLGAQAPSAVRSQKMDDVIFAGTAKRPALGRAEVSLTIDNANGLLPIEFTEVTLTRTLWRSGDSEYAINGVPCRLLDIQELLSDSGVGRQQHVIVGQGQIDAVLNARPDDRRGVIEEAAGVLKYRKRKERAERRLDATEANLLRVQDLLREVRRQLRPLERQAEAARRYGEVVAELTALRVHVAGREIAGLQRRLEGLAVEERDLRQQDESVRRELARMDTEVLAAEARLGASGASDLGDLLVRVEQLRERARGLTAVLHERRRSLERDRAQLMDASVAASLEADAARLRSEQAAVAEAQAALEPDVAALEADEAAAVARRAPAVDDDLADRTTADEGTTDPADSSRAARAAAEVRGELHARRSAHQADEERLARAEAELVALGERQAALDGVVEAAQARLAEAEAAEAPLLAELDAVRAAHSAAVAAAEEAGASRAAAAERHTEWSARGDALALALDAARARAGAEHLSDVDGALGTLLDLVEIDPGWQAAAEAALGEALAAVVVTDAGAARRALDHLDQVDVGGGVLAAAGPPPVPAAATPGARVRHHVRAADPTVDGLLDRLLQQAVVVAGPWADALDVALAHPSAVVVTRNGDRFSATGFRLGLGGAGATASALDEARRRAEEAATALAAATAALDTATAATEATQAEQAAAAARLEAHDAEAGRAAATLERLRRERREVAEALARGRSEHEAGHDGWVRAGAVIANLEQALVALEADEATEADAARRRHVARVRQEAEVRSLAARRRDLAVRAAGIEERATMVARRLADVERRLAEGVRAQADAADRIGRTERAAVAVERLDALVARHRAVIDVRLTELQDERRRQTDEARAASLALEHLRRERAEAERLLAEIGERQRRVEIAEAEARTRLEAAVEHVRRELDTEPGAAVAAPAPPLAEGVTPAARVRELEREIRLMGPINPLALEEFTSLQERHRFLEEQLEDVRSTRRDLQRVIRSVDAEIQSVFAAAFADVSESFTALFTTLFPGGTGRLILTDPDDLLSTGIEVEAKPSGKNVKKLSLLSGGERSLTALAFLFAVFRSRPSPFYVMDEVEAALDDVNLHRFLSLVSEFRADAQLLVVSHQKRTMEAGDCLIGVTMQPGGSSKVITERVTAEV
jgi:chromosome segregation protein